MTVSNKWSVLLIGIIRRQDSTNSDIGREFAAKIRILFANNDAVELHIPVSMDIKAKEAIVVI